MSDEVNIKGLEPNLAPSLGIAEHSMAISAKRQADALERIADILDRCADVPDRPNSAAVNTRSIT